MKSASPELDSDLRSELTTLATCWKLIRADGVVMGFTTHVEPLLIAGVTYSAAAGTYSPSNIRTTSDMSVDSLELEAVLDDAAITEADLRGGKYNMARVEIFQVNYVDTSRGVLNLRGGWLGEVIADGTTFRAELRGLTQALQQTIGRVYGKRCSADLGDSRCKVSLGGFTVTGTVLSVASREQFVASVVPARRGGLLTWTGGENDGHQMEVKSIAGSTIVLNLPMGYDIAPGDTFSAYAGCDKLLSTCKGVFGNVINFRGHPYIPGPDRALQYPDAK